MAFTELNSYLNGMFTLVKGLKTNSKEVERGRCMGGVMESCISVRRKEVKWKYYIERIMNEENS